MKKIDLTTLTDNVFNLIGKEWLLITAGDKNGFNTMTASWGCIGWLWNRPVAVVFIRPERYTHLLAEQSDHITLSFLGNGDEAREIYNLCGSKSGRDCDKIKESGLQPIETESGNIAFTQSRLTLECRKLYKDSIKPECFIDNSISKWYGEKGCYHDAYILEIVNAYTA